MTEIWKNVKGYEELLQVSNIGRLRTKNRYVSTGNGGYRFVNGRIIKPVKCTNGYYEAQINKDGKRKIFLLHRLVASHFIPNPDNLPEVNHKNENIADCRAENLEWCTSKYNANYGTRNIRSAEKQMIKVNQYDLDGNYIKTWKSISSVEKELGIASECVIRCCQGKYKQSGGYTWKYA